MLSVLLAYLSALTLLAVAQQEFSNARITFYNAGLGACGETNNDNQPILALNTAQFGNGQYCNKEITITANGKTKDATIKDSCPGCPFGGLDLTPSLFSFFADQGAGHISGSWKFKDGSGGGTTVTNASTTGAPSTGPGSTGAPNSTGPGSTGAANSTANPGNSSAPGYTSSATVPAGVNSTTTAGSSKLCHHHSH
ncbi:uncharacterized protein FOMMEDRAFT_161373 [Fomitiporia mediterranea MF3/22]|uniref:uncharacterized protein n=1 Tax=Fomitiporia mediterranea (strain MF3/22) TaxID=694068 RepID=UPI00044096A3|nr:uncharacterized protein FOMMEDRAFT_161373 [Fomitiporia mediterranea MF3/22]EJC98558.1 hypothetical protein FOMMEDRAFT_161373 [Fomitiporia mediterranea MF3/22]